MTSRANVVMVVTLTLHGDGFVLVEVAGDDRMTGDSGPVVTWLLDEAAEKWRATGIGDAEAQ